MCFLVICFFFLLCDDQEGRGRRSRDLFQGLRKEPGEERRRPWDSWPIERRLGHSPKNGHTLETAEDLQNQKFVSLGLGKETRKIHSHRWRRASSLKWEEKMQRDWAVMFVLQNEHLVFTSVDVPCGGHWARWEGAASIPCLQNQGPLFCWQEFCWYWFCRSCLVSS